MILYVILWPLAWLLTHILCRYRVIGRANVPRQGPILIVANHLLWYDPLLLGIILPRRLWFMAKVEIFRLPFIGLGCRLTGQIPVHRGESDRTALETTLLYLRTGRAVTIFPEGVVAQHDGLLQAHTGAAMLALRSGVPILPVAHTGIQRIFAGRGAWWPRVEVRIGEPYIPVVPEGISRKAALKLVTEDLMLRIAQMMPTAERGVYALLTQAQKEKLGREQEDPRDA